ncbi:MAG TPA: hypothetical protein VFV50_10870 [Bdellovibrionales bacterium]|nr:hypothetical protein [Bdellovibrionales bacterium]
MQKRSDVVIVSAFGRGNSLSRSLAKRGLTVSLVDVSDQLGRWTPEDWAGPFGSFEEDAAAEAKAGDVDLVELARGLTVWLSDRPLEMRGPLTPFTLSKLGISESTIRYLKEARLPGAAMLRRDLEKEPFEATWLAHFAQQFSSNVYFDNFESLTRGYCRPLLSKFFMRKTTRERIVQSFGECLAAGVKVFTSARIVDISIVNQKLDAVEISSERSGVLTGDLFVWLLSSEECEVFPERVRALMYPKGPVESSWCWVRFGFQVPAGPEESALPDHFVMLKDIRLPWTHAHCCLVQKNHDLNRYDFWVRIPSKRRFQRSFLDEVGSQIQTELKARLPAVSPVLLERPPEYLVSHKELGAPRFQVYLESHLKNLKRLSLRNLLYCGPEDWVSLDANGQGLSMQMLQNHLMENFVQRKEEPRDRPLHPS